MCIRDRARARHLFTTLNDSIWLALCTWQENPLSWVSPNLSQSVVYLQNALADLENAGACLLYTSDAADERSSVDLGGRRIIKKKKKQEHVNNGVEQ